MSEPRSYREQMVWKKAERLVVSVMDISDEIPRDNFYDLKARLINCIEMVPPQLREGFRKTRRIDRVRQWIKVNCLLQECRDYLMMVKMLRYGKPTEQIELIDDLYELLLSDHGNGVN